MRLTALSAEQARALFQSARPRRARPPIGTVTVSLFQSACPCGARRSARTHAQVEGRVSIRTAAWDATRQDHLAQPAVVSIRALAWSATAEARAVPTYRLFQSARPRGARRAIYDILIPTAPFQSARPRGARPGTSVTFTAVELFQSARPRGARRTVRYKLDHLLQFQSARPRGARREVLNGLVVDGVVSIRTPAWGATRPPVPARWPLPVSIRTPAWGATCGTAQAVTHFALFQSARPRGARQRSLASLSGVSQFQSARPRGARRAFLARKRLPLSFNPHARVGRDDLVQGAARVIVVSIRTPAWGATFITVTAEAKCSRFNPHARVGRDTASRPSAQCRSLFQSARPRGARQPASA